MKSLSNSQLGLVGLTLFSMFFGAGNLIFPSFLGAMAGTNTWIAMAGFMVTAVGFPVLGVLAVARSGGLSNLAGRVHPGFAFLFTLLIYLSIGPCLAIPRTASTSFEMAVVPFLGSAVSVNMAQLIYSAVFFFIAFLVAQKPDKLTERLGKIMTPCLLILITVIFAGCVGTYGAVSEDYQQVPFIKGFLEGYQTMDTIAALNFGIIIALNIRALGISDEKQVVKETIKAGLIAGGILLVIYGALAHIGAVTSSASGPSPNGAVTLTQSVQYLFGNVGTVLLAIIFFIACLNTCIGLISCCSKYFCTIIPAPGYRGWSFLFAAVSLIISNVGLNRILEFSVPVLNAIYPASIMLILLSFLFGNGPKWRPVYVWTMALTGGTSILLALEGAGAGGLRSFLSRLPLYDAGLGWTVPALCGIILGILVSFTTHQTAE